MRHRPVAERDYDEFVDALYGNKSGTRLPLFGSLTLTYRCNLHCRHCYAVPDPNRKEADTATVCSWLDQIADAGCLWLLITGGEPLLRGDFAEIYQHAKQRGFIITVFTNGTLIDGALARLWQEYPPYLVEVTMYGATEETAQRVTGAGSSLQACLNGIKLLQEYDIPLRLKATLTRANVRELGAMRTFAEEQGIDFRFDALLWPRIDKSRAPFAERIPAQDLVRLDAADAKRRRGWREFGERFGQPSCSALMFSCTAGQGSFDIDPYGILRPCDMARQVGYDLKQGAFMTGWQIYFPQVLAQQKRCRDAACRNCAVSAWCDMCAAWAWLEQGVDEAHSEYLCEIARGRAAAFSSPELKEEYHERSERKKRVQQAGSTQGQSHA